MLNWLSIILYTKKIAILCAHLPYPPFAWLLLSLLRCLHQLFILENQLWHTFQLNMPYLCPYCTLCFLFLYICIIQLLLASHFNACELKCSSHVINIFEEWELNKYLPNEQMNHFSLVASFFFCFKGTEFRVSSPSILPIAVLSNKEAHVQRIKPICGTYSVQRNQKPLTCSFYVRRIKTVHTPWVLQGFYS